MFLVALKRKHRCWKVLLFALVLLLSLCYKGYSFLLSTVHPPTRKLVWSTYVSRIRHHLGWVAPIRYTPDLLWTPDASGGYPNLPPLESRQQTGHMLETLGFKGSGVEVGVATGLNVAQTLKHWPSCSKFYLVDIWQKGKPRQEQNYKDALQNTAPWKEKIKVMRLPSVEAAAQIEDQSLDYVYIDAVHDYCNCKEDMEAWWPKVRPGGVFAGHDYGDLYEMTHGHTLKGYIYNTRKTFAVCPDGSVVKGAVKAAVNEFAQKHKRMFFVTYGEPYYDVLATKSWFMRK